MKWILPIVVVLAVSGSTLVIVWFRHQQLAAEEPSSAEPLPRHLFAFAFTMAAFLFGIAISVGFYFATGWWQSAERVLFWTAASLTILFSIGAVVVRTQVVKSGAAESVALNLIWGLGYGWVLPSVMRALGLVR